MLRANAPPFIPRHLLPASASATSATSASKASTASSAASLTPARAVAGAGPSDPAPDPAAPPARTAPLPRPQDRLRPGGLSGAGYLWTRCMREGGIDAQTFHTFQRVQEAIERTREQLPWGRGNVLGDAVRTAQASTLRNIASREHLPPPHPPARDRQQRTADLAADARFMQAGNCDEFTALAQVNLAAHLAPGERIEVLDSEGADHTWPELVQSGGPESPTRWTADAWAEGTAMRMEDTRLASTLDRAVTGQVGPSDAAALAAGHQRRLAHLQTHTSPEAVLEVARTALQSTGQILGPPDFDRPTIWRPEIEADLRSRVEADLAHGPAADGEDEPAWSPAHHPLRRVLPDVAAVAVVRQYGAGVAEAAALAPPVIEAGLSLSQLDRAPGRQATRVAQGAMQAHLQRLYGHLGETPRQDPSRPPEAA